MYVLVLSFCVLFLLILVIFLSVDRLAYEAPEAKIIEKTPSTLLPHHQKEIEVTPNVTEVW